MAGFERRSLYRHALRTFSRLAPPARANLLRVVRPELRLAVVGQDWDAAQASVTATTTLFSSSPKLSYALASLAYHHYPGHLPHTHSRRYPTSSVIWNSDDPEAAMKAYQTDQRRKVKDVGQIMGDKVNGALNEVLRQVEAGTGAVVGRLGVRRGS